MKNLPPTPAEENTITSSNHSREDAQVSHRISHLARTVLAFSIALTGCDVSVRPTKPPSPIGATESMANDLDTTKLDAQLSGLQSELTHMNSSLSSDVAQLREEVKTKADKAEVKEIVQRELKSIRERLKRLDERTKNVDQKLDELEEHLGIMSRTPEAPWYEKEGEE